MSTYYEYREVKVMIAHKLMAMDGWKVYGYHSDKSDSMTDYYNPASWGGVAEKNGYILCVDVYGAEKEKEIRKYNKGTLSYDKNIMDKIAKLENMTVERGACESEAASARETIERLQKKAEEDTEEQSKYIVTSVIPAHMAHPPRCNWHIEKDGMIIAKGNGLLKYSSVHEYFAYSQYEKSMKDFRKQSKELYVSGLASEYMNNNYYSDKEKAIASAESQYTSMQKKVKLVDDFNKFVNKLDTTCGCLVGEGDLETYEKIITTEYKKELKAVETETGSIKDGQCFILKTTFNYGCCKGLVYRIHRIEYNGKEYFNAYKLNGKLTKECTGKANSNNHWSTFNEKFMIWIEKGSIAWCELQEVKTPYEVEKVVKKTIKPEKKANTMETKERTTSNTETMDISNLTFIITEDTDTRNGEQIFLVKVEEKLNRDEYLNLNKFIKSLGGYYSKFKHAFLFKENPSELLSGNIVESEQTEAKVTINIEVKEEVDKGENKSTEIIEALKRIDAKEEQTEATEGTRIHAIERVYFNIDEKLARNARGMWSFDDYVNGSETEEYKKEVDKVYLLVEKIAQAKPEHTAEAENLAERYSRKYAEWINKKHSIDMMCPSVMICGAGNFPIKKKERQNARTDKHWTEYGYIQAIPEKIKKLLYGETVIKSGDANAVEKLQEKLDELETLQNGMKKANAYYKKNGTLEGFEGLKQSTIDVIIDDMKNDWYGNRPFPSYALTNNNAKIKATKTRLDKLVKVKEQGTQEQTETTEEGNDLFKVVENVEIMRLQLLFDGKPEEEIRNVLKKNGFRWSPKNGAWQRQLTDNARYSLKRVVEQLKTA